MSRLFCGNLHDSHMSTFHRILENIDVEIISPYRVFCHCNSVHFCPQSYHCNFYILMAGILNSNSETCLREIIHDQLQHSKNSLKNLFLTSNCRSSNFFKSIWNLDELQQVHKFCLLKIQDTIQNWLMSSNYIPEIFLFLICLVYKKILHSTICRQTQHIFSCFGNPGEFNM